MVWLFTSLYAIVFSLGFSCEIYTGLGERVSNLIFCHLSSYFASQSLHKNFHNPRTKREKSLRGLLWWWVRGLKVSLVLALVEQTRIWALDLDWDQANKITFSDPLCNLWCLSINILPCPFNCSSMFGLRNRRTTGKPQKKDRRRKGTKMCIQSWWFLQFPLLKSFQAYVTRADKVTYRPHKHYIILKFWNQPSNIFGDRKIQ